MRPEGVPLNGNRQSNPQRARSRRAMRTTAACLTTLGTLAVIGCSGDRAEDRLGSGARSRTSSSTTSTSTTPPVVGSDGLGDRYYPKAGNGGYDVTGYDLDLVVAIDGPDQIAGTATIDATTTQSLSSFDLDLLGFTVDKVTVDGTDAAFERRDQELVVTPTTPLPSGEEFEVVVSYQGAPGRQIGPVAALDEGGWIDLDGYSTVLAEPIGAATWFPANDHPTDKATMTITATVADPLEAVANGHLVERTTRPDRPGTTTFRWEATEPMSPYLASLTVGELDLVEDQIGSAATGTRILNAVPPSQTGLLTGQFARFAEMIGFFGERWGKYPFADAGNVVVPGLEPIALECQTRSVHSLGIFTFLPPTGPGSAESVVAHELAHQWFGDSVSPARWQDVWLNEGFATYGEWLWDEHAGGPTVEAAARRVHRDDPRLDVPPADPGTGELFGPTVYQRAGMFLVELRRQLGVERFDELARTWLTDHSGSTATTEEFVALAVAAGGEPTQALADAWLHGAELPDLAP